MHPTSSTGRNRKTAGYPNGLCESLPAQPTSSHGRFGGAPTEPPLKILHQTKITTLVLGQLASDAQRQKLASSLRVLPEQLRPVGDGAGGSFLFFVICTAFVSDCIMKTYARRIDLEPELRLGVA